MEGGTPRPWMTSPVYGEPHESWYECHESEIPLPGTTDPEMGPLVRGIVVGAIGYPQEGRVEAPGAAAQRAGRSARRTRRVHGDTLPALLTLPLLRLSINGHLLRCTHPSSLRRTCMYASFLRISRALHLAISHQPLQRVLFDTLWLARVSRRKRVETMATSAHRNRTRKACS